jgi:hypothetical protein
LDGDDSAKTSGSGGHSVQTSSYGEEDDNDDDNGDMMIVNVPPPAVNTESSILVRIAVLLNVSVRPTLLAFVVIFNKRKGGKHGQTKKKREKIT